MRKIKRLFEFFDDEDLRSKYEIPYLKGEMPDMISKFKDYEMSGANHFTDLVLFRYPILDRFHTKQIKNRDGSDLNFFYATSLEEYQGEEYYCSLSLAFYKNKYYVITIFRKLKDLDQRNFDVAEYSFDTIEKALPAVEVFLEKCEKFKIVKPNWEFDIKHN